MASTYALRSGSELATHTGLRVKVSFFAGVYEVIWYGPSEYILLYTAGVPGSPFSASIGTAVNGASVIAPSNHAAGWVSVNVIVLPDVVMPDTLWPST